MEAEAIRYRLRESRIPIDSSLPEKLAIYLGLLLDWNQRMDLIADIPEEEILDRHFIDSLTVLKTGLLEGTKRLIDVGCGAGFPGMVLALACPDRQVTLLDAQQKRLNFLSEVVAKTSAHNVTLVHARAEDGARKPELRETFDIATARALAPMNVLSEYLLPYVRVGGRALCWKGPSLEEELAAGTRAARRLGGMIEEPVLCEVAGRDWQHVIVPIRKTAPTPPAYPRKAGTPKNNPLG